MWSFASQKLDNRLLLCEFLISSFLATCPFSIMSFLPPPASFSFHLWHHVWCSFVSSLSTFYFISFFVLSFVFLFSLHFPSSSFAILLDHGSHGHISICFPFSHFLHFPLFSSFFFICFLFFLLLFLLPHIVPHIVRLINDKQIDKTVGIFGRQRNKL